MKNAELIKALRWCQTHGCSKCVALLESGSCKYGGAIKIFETAADALEAADKRIKELEAQEPTEKQVVDYCRKRCHVIVTGELFQRMKATFSRMQKEGEWETTDNRWGCGKFRCTVCNSYENDKSNYCPKCGARMNGKKEKR